MNEVYGYDWNLFIADLGGSLGFLLGLSVLGLVSTLEHIVNLVLKVKKVKDNANIEQGEKNKAVEENEAYKAIESPKYQEMILKGTNFF